MRGVKRCQESTGRMKKHRYSNGFKVTAVEMANATAIEMKVVAMGARLGPEVSGPFPTTPPGVPTSP